jgi:hypothetical protein
MLPSDYRNILTRQTCHNWWEEVFRCIIILVFRPKGVKQETYQMGNPTIEQEEQARYKRHCLTTNWHHLQTMHHILEKRERPPSAPPALSDTRCWALSGLGPLGVYEQDSEAGIKERWFQKNHTLLASSVGWERFADQELSSAWQWTGWQWDGFLLRDHLASDRVLGSHPPAKKPQKQTAWAEKRHLCCRMENCEENFILLCSPRAFSQESISFLAETLSNGKS